MSKKEKSNEEWPVVGEVTIRALEPAKSTTHPKAAALHELFANKLDELVARYRKKDPNFEIHETVLCEMVMLATVRDGRNLRQIVKATGISHFEFLDYFADYMEFCTGWTTGRKGKLHAGLFQSVRRWISKVEDDSIDRWMGTAWNGEDSPDQVDKCYAYLVKRDKVEIEEEPVIDPEIRRIKDKISKRFERFIRNNN